MTTLVLQPGNRGTCWWCGRETIRYDTEFKEHICSHACLEKSLQCVEDHLMIMQFGYHGDGSSESTSTSTPSEPINEPAAAIL